MTLKSFTNIMLPAIEDELQRVVTQVDQATTRNFHEMLTYHMGWSGEGAGPEATGKRIRPLLVLLSCSACGGEWQLALPAAASVELIHNFSLVHDDIQDGSELRRGRSTVWKKWGLAQAINAGDALFILAHKVLSESRGGFAPEMVLKAERIVDEACLALSSGQFLDISYEKRMELPIEEYWQMVSGKTAALLSACTQIGSLLGGAQETTQKHYKSFGHYLGLAFQAQDDFLGIWGNLAMTGKSNESDLMAGKKSLPVLFGLANKGQFALRWAEGPIPVGEIAALSEFLEEEGVKTATQAAADEMTGLALNSLRLANPQGAAGEALRELTKTLLNRKA
jgi:geranylgeranyl diphosphate synthase type I